jgi:hypothetical protein
VISINGQVTEEKLLKIDVNPPSNPFLKPFTF